MEKIQKKSNDLLTISAAEEYAKTKKKTASQWLMLRAVASGSIQCERMTISGKERIFFEKKELDRWLALQSDR